MLKNKLKFNKKFNTKNLQMMMDLILTQRYWMHIPPEMLEVIQIKPLLRRQYSRTKERQLRLKKMLLAIRWLHQSSKSLMKRFKLKLHQFKKLLQLPPLLLLLQSPFLLPMEKSRLHHWPPDWLRSAALILVA